MALIIEKMVPMTRSDLLFLHQGPPGGVLVAVTRSGLENAMLYFKRKWIREMKTARFDNFPLLSGKYKNPFMNEDENYEIRYGRPN